MRKANTKKQHKDPIRWRGHEVTRIEAFSDAVFAFAVTLLIVSLEVPKNFEEMMENMKGFFPFAIGFAIFFMIWSTQNEYFRRFGLHDEFTLAINAVLLFVVLFFVYPLKFLWNMVLLRNVVIKEPSDGVHLFVIYGLGFTAIFLLFAGMYWHAWRRREYLELTHREVWETRTDMFQNLYVAGVGIISVLIAAMGPVALMYAPMSYMLMAGIGMLKSHRRKMYEQKYGSGESVVGTEKVLDNIPSGEPVEN